MLKFPVAAGLIALFLLPTSAFPESSGKFSVFGPSAEREAFFATQRRERIDREDALRNEALEREKLAIKERIAANEAKQKSTATTGVPAYCWRVPTGRVTSFTPTIPSPPGISVTTTARAATQTYATRCAPRVGYYHHVPSQTNFNLKYDNGWSGHAIVQRPGLSIDLNFD